MKKVYKCSICSRQNVKLWRPYMGTEPLICAKCAEERQTTEEYDECMTNQLKIDLKDVSDPEYAGVTTMVPAVPDENGDFWAYTSVSEDGFKWWEELPTK